MQQTNGPVAIQKLTTPVTLGKLIENNKEDDSSFGKSVLDIKKSDITVILNHNLLC